MPEGYETDWTNATNQSCTDVCADGLLSMEQGFASISDSMAAASALSMLAGVLSVLAMICPLICTYWFVSA